MPDEIADGIAPLLATHDLAHIAPYIRSLCATLTAEGRPELLRRLKAEPFHVHRLVARQALANALGKLIRDGRLPEEVPEASSSRPLDFDPYLYAGGTGIDAGAALLVPAERALAGRPHRLRSMGALTTHHVLGTPLRPVDDWPECFEVAVLAAGCFWGLEKGLWRLPGVYSTSVGYVGGHTPHPTYSEVCSGLTGHTEAVKVAYDPSRLAYTDLLRWFWECHDPTQGMGQGRDRGTQYRSAIWPLREEHAALATASRDAYQIALHHAGGLRGQRTITTELWPPPPAGAAADAADGRSVRYFEAEEYHMQYLARPGNAPYCTAEPLMVSLPPFHTWAPLALRDTHAPRLGDAFWKKHGPEAHCALNRPNEPIWDPPQ